MLKTPGVVYLLNFIMGASLFSLMVAALILNEYEYELNLLELGLGLLLFFTFAGITLSKTLKAGRIEISLRMFFLGMTASIVVILPMFLLFFNNQF